MFLIQRLINEPFEIYSKELSESFEILSPKKEFLAKNIGNYSPTDYVLYTYLLPLFYASFVNSTVDWTLVTCNRRFKVIAARDMTIS